MLGYTPQQVNDMSVWQFMAAVDGYVDANSADDGSLTTKEIEEIWDWL